MCGLWLDIHREGSVLCSFTLSFKEYILTDMNTTVDDIRFNLRNVQDTLTDSMISTDDPGYYKFGTDFIVELNSLDLKPSEPTL